MDLDDVVSIDEEFEQIIQDVELLRKEMDWLKGLYKILKEPIKKDMGSLQDELARLPTYMYQLAKLKSKSYAQYRLAKYKAMNINAKGDNAKTIIEGKSAHYKYAYELILGMWESVKERNSNAISLHSAMKVEMEKFGDR